MLRRVKKASFLTPVFDVFCVVVLSFWLVHASLKVHTHLSSVYSHSTLPFSKWEMKRLNFGKSILIYRMTR